MPRGAPGQPRRRRGGPSYSQRPDGRWSLTVELPRGPDNQRRRHQGTYRSYAEAQLAYRALDYNAAPITAQQRELTVKQLLDRELALAPHLEHSSQENRAWILATLTAALGHRQVTKLTRQDVQLFQQAMQRDGRAPSTISKCIQRLRTALDQAVEAGLLRTNPAAGVRAVRSSSQRRLRVWTPPQVQAIIRVSANSPLHILVLLAMTTGARLGELLGARRQDYDAASGVLTITGTLKKGGGRGDPKTAAAVRTLPLAPEVQQAMTQHLAEVRERQLRAGPTWGQRRQVSEATRLKQRAAAQARAGSRLPAGWRPTPPPAAPFEPLIPTTHGTPWSARNAQREWARILQEAGVPHAGFHTIRAHFATEAALAGVSTRQLQDVLGHASPLMSLYYQRSVAGSEGQVIQTVAARLLPEARPEPAE